MMEKNGGKLERSVKERLISELIPELGTLRKKAEVSQGDLANMLGVSRQTYNAIESGSRKLTWNVYLSLILYYDYNQKTHQMIRALGVFPQELVTRINNGEAEGLEIDSFLSQGPQDILDKLDEQAMRSIRAMVMVEYGRCTGMSSDAVVKAFDGVVFSPHPASAADVAAKRAISAIKGRKKHGQ